MSFRSLISSRRVAPLALAPVVFAGLSSSASAHVGLHTGGLADGLAHPFLGLDHLLAMVAVGLWAAQLGRTARWALPAAFLAAMALGAVVGASGLALPWIELGIAASVVVLGAAVAFSLTPTLAVSSSLIAAFALLHGYTHGAELPQAASGFAYGAGFTTATLALQAIGLALGTISRGTAARAAGAAIAAVGVALLVTA
jgi:urease accessory protein